MTSKNLPRNSLCSCGSGRKYKFCCGSVNQSGIAQANSPAGELLGNARRFVSQGDLVKAEYCFRQILTVAPQHAEALAGVGQCLCWQQKTVEGLRFLKMAAKALQRDAEVTKQVRPLIDLGTQLLHWGDLTTMLELAECSIELAPDNAAALNHLALCYSRTNRDQDALPYAYRACQLLPDDPGCNILLAILETRQGHLAEAQQRLEHIVRTCRDEEQLARAYLELGVVLDKLGRFDEAFSAFTKASAKQVLLPAVQAIDAEGIFSAIKDNHVGFNSALLQRWPVSLFLDDALPIPIFLFGFLRSGTTLTEQVLAAHPDILTSNEEPFIAELIAELRRMSRTTDTIPTLLGRLTIEDVRYLRRFYWQRVSEKYATEMVGKRFIDKFALNSIEAGLIGCIFPEAKILFALRDPRDVCLSCYMQAFAPSPATVNLLSWAGVAKQYAAVMGYWLAIRDALLPGVMELRYEDTVYQFEGTYRKVFDFLNISWHSECAKFHVTVAGRYIATPSFSAVSQPLYNTAAGRWIRYAQHFDPILPQLQPYIEAFAYAG
ncbi:MAG: sulfotransferase [Methylococcales bacterium]